MYESTLAYLQDVSQLCTMPANVLTSKNCIMENILQSSAVCTLEVVLILRCTEARGRARRGIPGYQISYKMSNGCIESK